MSESINVLSLFDGISCGQQALKKAKIKVKNYYASEIDTYAMNVTRKNFPKTKFIGDVSKVSGYDYEKIDLFIGGSPCFVEGTKIICKNEIKDIKDVKVGDYVLTHKNRYKKVLKIGNTKKQIFNLLSQSHTGTRTTENHPYYVIERKYVWNKNIKKKEPIFSSPKWKDIKDINIGDFVGTPIIKTSKNPENITKEEAFLIGVYIGDGHTRKDYRTSENRPTHRHWQLIISVGSHEENLFKEKINLKHSFYKHTQNVFRAVFSNKRLVQYVEKNCGIGAENKFFSKEILDLPKELLKEVIEGYLFADGSYRKNTHRATTISRNLVETLSLAVAKVYKTTTCIEYTIRDKTTVIEGRTVNQKNTWTISFRKKHPKGSRAYIIDNIVWNPVKKITKEEKVEKVYNLEVEDDNSYIANNHIVHNCQGFSFSGKRLNFDDPRSALFFEYVRILEEVRVLNPDVKFLLENVVMEKKHENVITEMLGVKPIKINSSLVSAQQRNRLYWTNIEGIEQPKDKKIFWNKVQIEDKDNDVMYYSDKAFEWIFKDEKRIKKYKEYTETTKSKMQMIEASHYKGYSNQRCFGIRDKNGRVRFIHPIECERCQNIKDNYTKFGKTDKDEIVKISRTQRYHMIGNAWTVDVIAHIFKNLDL